MYSLTDTTLESNKQFKINFNGGDLSSDAGLLLIKEFAYKLGFTELFKREFKTNDDTRFRLHKDHENLWHVIYQIIGAYFEDDCADELTNDPVMTAVLGKRALASQPTLSRFFNRMDVDTFSQFYNINKEIRKTVYSIRKPEVILCWTLIPLFLIPMAIRKGKDSTITTRSMDTIRLYAMMV